jgi:hypothetical protein
MCDFVRVNSIGRAIHHLYVINGDVGLGAAGAVLLDAADEPCLVSSIVFAIAVDDEIGHRDILDGL